MLCINAEIMGWVMRHRTASDGSTGVVFAISARCARSSEVRCRATGLRWAEAMAAATWIRALGAVVTVVWQHEESRIKLIQSENVCYIATSTA